jgi:squalene-hopene cyclase-like protein/prenyltransferase/squalene oxidase-like repeat protein
MTAHRTTLVTCVILALLPLYARAASNAEMVTLKTHKAISRALSFLKKTQNSDGSWSSSQYGRHPAITGLACMALMAQGNAPGRGKYGKPVERAVKFLMKSVDPRTGYIGGQGHGQMYGHGFATLALAEAYGMMPSDTLRKKLRLAIKCIIKSQKPDGGWRYDPTPYGRSDLSLTICQMMALRAANNAGIKVGKKTIDRAVAYTKKSANADGGFRYTLDSGGSSFALTGAGVTTLYGAGLYNTTEAKKGLDYLKKFVARNRGQGRYGHYFYGHYYAAQAMYQAGGKHWEFWYPKVRDELLRLQLSKGSWSSNVGETYGAAMGALVLQVPYNYLPIFQR